MSTISPHAPPTPYRSPLPLDSPGGRTVSWGAIVAGAVASAALMLILLVLGTGLGFSAVSPWSGEGASAFTVGFAAVLWLTFTQIAASGMGGYLAGRLRNRWADTGTDEVYFRDTAHGFLSWALATLVTAGLLTSAVSGLIGTGVQAGAQVAGGAAAVAGVAAPAAAAGLGAQTGANEDGASGAMGYFVDGLFRREAGDPGNPTDAESPAAEVGRIFVNAARQGTLSPEDTRYVAQLVSQRTGLSQADAEKRVTDGFARMRAQAAELENAAREAADQARKATAYSSLWLFVSLLIAAFSASLAATYGGRQRDLA